MAFPLPSLLHARDRLEKLQVQYMLANCFSFWVSRSSLHWRNWSRKLGGWPTASFVCVCGHQGLGIFVTQVDLDSFQQVFWFSKLCEFCSKFNHTWVHDIRCCMVFLALPKISLCSQLSTQGRDAGTSATRKPRDAVAHDVFRPTVYAGQRLSIATLVLHHGSHRRWLSVRTKDFASLRVHWRNLPQLRSQLPCSW